MKAEQGQNDNQLDSPQGCALEVDLVWVFVFLRVEGEGVLVF